MNTKKLINLFLALTLALGTFASLPATPVRAATQTVTNTDDSGSGSLRQAIINAADNDTIDLTGISGMITLATELTVNKSVTITGPGASALTISGNNAVRVFNIASGKIVSISGLTVANGRVEDNLGGGILNLGNLTLNNVVVTNNAAARGTQGPFVRGGGIYSQLNESSLTITNSVISNNTAAGEGGGIYIHSGVLNLQNVTIDNNHVTDSTSVGGGINIGSNVPTPVTFNNLTISNNSAVSGGGGLISYTSLTIFNSVVFNNSVAGGTNLNDGRGGGMYLTGSSKTYTLTNVTISGNSASHAVSSGVGGGGIVTNQTLNLTNVTITGNTSQGGGGGIYGTANMLNTIIAGNTSTSAASEDCAGTLNSSHGHNMIQVITTCTLTGTTTGNIYNTDPLLNSLADNGGPTMTHSLQTGSPAIDAGISNENCPGLDQRGIARPQDGNGDNTSACDIGAYEVAVFPTVSSITLANPNPTSKNSVDFTVTFSKYVTGVDASDFALTATTIGASVTGVATTNNSSYTVTVNTGTGNGTVRLDLADDNSIMDTINNPLGGMGIGDGNFTSGETYTVQKISTFKSAATPDGWVLESSETSGVGGTLNKGGKTLLLGDDEANRQYRAILSFATASLPDDADITKVTLRVRRQGVTGGGNPVTTFGGFMVDIKTGNFGTAGLQLADFSTKGSKTYGAFKPKADGSGWYTINLTTGKDFINKVGNTQIRLRFKVDDNNDFVANFLSLHSGNAASASKPQLIVEYYVP
jgi:hypothetical protein